MSKETLIALAEFVPDVERNGHCKVCDGTHYGTLQCPFRCRVCGVNTEYFNCAQAACPRRDETTE